MKSIGGADGAAVGRSAASSREQGRSSRIPVQCGRIVLKTAAAAAVGTRPVRLGRLVDWRRTADGGRRVRVQSRGRSGDHDKTTRAPKSLVLGWKSSGPERREEVAALSHATDGLHRRPCLGRLHDGLQAKRRHAHVPFACQNHDTGSLRHEGLSPPPSKPPPVHSVPPGVALGRQGAAYFLL